MSGSDSVWVGRSEPDPASVRRILELLPDWFGIPAAIDDYVAKAATMPTYLARDGGADGTVIGVELVLQHFPESAEVYLLAADPAWHRQGVGRALIEAVVADQRATGANLLQVKTLAESHPDPYYAETRKFYRALGFVPVEELGDLWGEGNSSLLLVRPL